MLGHHAIAADRIPAHPARRRLPAPVRSYKSSASGRPPTGRARPSPADRPHARPHPLSGCGERGDPAHAAPPPGPGRASTIMPINSPSRSAQGLALTSCQAARIRSRTPHRRVPPRLGVGTRARRSHHGPRPPRSPGARGSPRATANTRGPPCSACTTHTRASTGSRSKKQRILHRPSRTRSRHASPSRFAAASSPESSSAVSSSTASRQSSRFSNRS